MACSKYDKIQKLQKKLDEMASDPATVDYLINKEMGERDKKSELNSAREEGENIGIERGKAIGRAEGEAIGMAKGENIGIAKGEAIGRTQSQKEIAKKLLEIKMPIEQIIEITGLTKEEIEKIK